VPKKCVLLLIVVMGLVTTKLLKTSEGNFKRKNPHNFLSDNSDFNYEIC
jgi:hypothetical protein